MKIKIKSKIPWNICFKNQENVNFSIKIWENGENNGSLFSAFFSFFLSFYKKRVGSCKGVGGFGYAQQLKEGHCQTGRYNKSQRICFLIFILYKYLFVSII